MPANPRPGRKRDDTLAETPSLISARKHRAKRAAQYSELEKLKAMLPNLQMVLYSAISDLERGGDKCRVLQALYYCLSLSHFIDESALNEQTHQFHQHPGPAVPLIVPPAYPTPGASMRFAPVDQFYYQTSFLSQRAESSAFPATLYSAATMQSSFTSDGTMFYNPHQLHESAEPSVTEEIFQRL